MTEIRGRRPTRDLSAASASLDRMIERNAKGKLDHAQRLYTGTRAAVEFRDRPTTRDNPERDLAFDRYVRTGDISPALERRDMSTVGASGGFLIPPSMNFSLLADAAVGSALLGHTEIVDTSQNASPGAPMNYPTLIDATHTSAALADDVALTESDIVLGNIAWPQAQSYITSRIAKVSRGLAADSGFDLTALLSTAWGLRVQRSVEADMTAAVLAGVTQTVTCGTASTIHYADLLAAFFAISGAYRAGAVWVFSPAAHLALRTAADTTNLRPLFLDAYQGPDVDNQGNVQNAMRLLGSPVLESVSGFQNNFTSGGVIGFYGDVSKVLPVRFAGADIRRQDEVHADTGEITWTGLSRWSASTIALASAGVLIKAL